MLSTRQPSAFCASLALHLALFAASMLMLHHGARLPVSTPKPSDREVARMVWLDATGRGGGGGGGGNGMKDPPRPAEMLGRDATTIPAAKPRVLDSSRPATREPNAVLPLLIPVASLASATDALRQAGAIGAPPSLTLSQGTGDGNGAGTGQGPGDGPGRGPGLGDGRDGGFGGDVYRPGNDVTMPVEVRKGIPRYTTEAMRARIQGSILVECVVQPEGACTNIRVKRSSFSPAFGLDDEAIKAATDWRFRPGTRRGQAVPVIVTMEIAFALR
jgi:protein TonB